VGDILEYHFIRQNESFSAIPGILDKMQIVLLDNLQTWLASFQKHVPPEFCITMKVYPETPTVAYYALHLYHCMHILVYGKMDLINMYDDIEWQKSPSFIKAGEHAVSCATVG
jgi:hypothetical protein